MSNAWKRALFAALPWVMLGGCDCSGCHSTGQTQQPLEGCNSSCSDSQGCKSVPSQGCGSPDVVPTACSTATDCPGVEDACTVPACVSSRCDVATRADGPAPPSFQTAGDCATLVCEGGTATMEAAFDPPSIGDACQVGACMGTSFIFDDGPDGVSCTLDGGSGFCVGGRCLRVPETLTGSASGSGGSGGAGPGTGGAGGLMSGAGGAGGTGAGGGDAGAPTCAKCAEVIYGDPATLLCSPSISVYQDLVDCVCTNVCEGDCGDNLCKGEVATGSCTACVASVDTGCGTPLTACNDDF